MSTRRERREQQRHQQKQKREINWAEIKKSGKMIMGIYIAFALILTPVLFYSSYSHNKERRKISVDPANTTAVVTHIYRDKRSGNYASYAFTVAGASYNGKTWNSYSGFVGDSVDITFNRIQPSLNLLSRDMPEQTTRSMIAGAGTLVIGLVVMMFVITLLYIFFKMFTGDKHFISEFTKKAD